MRQGALTAGIGSAALVRGLFGAWALLLLLQMGLLITSRDYNWDLDHGIYFGGRLLRGELIWTREFHDKLPVVPAIFVPAAALGGAWAWKLQSCLMALLGALAIWRLGPRLLPAGLRRGPVGALGALAFLHAGAFLPYSLDLITPTASSLLVMATLLLLVGPPGRGWRRGALVLGCAGLLAVAISIRPYFLPAALLLPAWAILRAPPSGRPVLPRIAAATAGWGLLLAAWGAALNFGPYLLTGQAEAVPRGLALIGQDLNPQPTGTAFLQLLTEVVSSRTLILLAALAALVLAWLALGDLLRGRRVLPGRRLRVDALFLAVLTPGAVAGMILGKHFWDHYLQMFTPMWALSVVVVAALAGRSLPPLPARLPWGVALLAALLALGLARVEVGRTLDRLLDGAAERHRFDPALPEVAGWLQGRRAAGLPTDVLHPSHMVLHWQLGEPRHGFPHAANTGHIFAGWWAGVEMPPGLLLPATPEAYCRLLEARGPTVVLEEEGRGFAWPCLLGSRAYARERAFPGAPGRPPLVAFVRREGGAAP